MQNPDASTRPDDALPLLERLAMGAVSVTARAVGDAAPELSLLQWRVLVVLAESPGGAAVSGLAARIGSRLPATSRLVGRMRRHGLVEAHKDRPDARVTTVTLAPGGRAIWERVTARRRADLLAMLETTAPTPNSQAGLERLARAMEPYL